ncbi:DHA2 family efflux MFS transporter permease subunit [Phaeacidiphilus oryzae]|uniref:DHA2 family efflux MFS transporter permease subunit n=1 Tax=Phaeacidiphilus oryzae TaxID=348818 RepID=UPI00068E9224|nr:DHA2 family efflux MFS transporter permease subunit [Phaeacidiphilus oryzae]
MFVLTLFLVVMDSSITTVALPSIARQFAVPTAAIDGVVVVYPVCVGMVIPASGWLGDRFGAKRVLLIAMALFTASSALCGTADSVGALVGYRALQGLSGGMLTPVANALLFRTFTTQERVRVSRFMSIPQQMAPAVAPLIGGWLVDGFSWRWVFYVNLPVGVCTVLFGALCLREQRHEGAGRFDLPGLLLAAAGMGTLMYGLSEGAQAGWATPRILGALCAGALLLAGTVWFELRTAEPMLRLRFFARRLFRDASVVNLFGLLSFQGAMYIAPLFLQEARGLSAAASGSSTFTEAIGVMLMVQLVSRIYGRMGPRRLISGGLLLVAATLAVMTGCDAHTGLWAFRGYMFLLGVGMGAVFMPAMVATFATVEQADVARASTLNMVLRQTSQALAPALVATVLAAGTVHGGGSAGANAVPAIGAYRAAYAVLAVIALAVAAYTALLMRDGSPRGPRGGLRGGGHGGGTSTRGRTLLGRIPRLPAARPPAASGRDTGAGPAAAHRAGRPALP